MQLLQIKVNYNYIINTNKFIVKLTFEYAGSVMLRLQMALWLRVRYVLGSFVKDSRPQGSCAVSLICPSMNQQFNPLITQNIEFLNL